MISGYRLMWLLIMFDLPVGTSEDRKNYRDFHDHLQGDGFSRVQFSVYARPCATEEKMEVHLGRVVRKLPPEGEVRVLKFTDKQWTRTLVFRCASAEQAERAPEQFLFFDEDMTPLFNEQAASGKATGRSDRDETGNPRRTARRRSRRKPPSSPRFDFFE